MSERVIDGLKVVIIGGGIAGLSTALTLHRRGVKNIAILEAMKEPGGRIKSVEFGGGYVDLGAQWFHGTENDLCQIAKEKGFLNSINSYEGLGNYYTTGGAVVPESTVSDVNYEITKAFYQLENHSTDNDIPESVGEYLTKEFKNYLDSCSNDSEELIHLKRQLFDWHLRFQVIDNACSDLWTLSAKYFGMYKFCGGDDYVNFKHGYSSIIEHLVSELPKGVLHTQCPARIIKWNKNDCQSPKNICEIVTEGGDIYRSEHVIVTCSAGYLKENWSMFDPALPLQYIKGFNCIGFDAMNKVYLEYDQRWWGNLQGIQFVWDSVKRKEMLKRDPKLWTCDLTGFDPVVGLPNVLLGWVGGDGAMLLENLPNDVISEHCTHILREFTGNNRIPEPKKCIKSSWYSNKYIRGGYSHLNISKGKYESILTALLKPVFTESLNFAQHPSILFAGEALHETCYSTTHGAFESGKQQALNLINLMS